MNKQVISIIGIGEVGAIVASLLLSKFTFVTFNLIDVNANEMHGKLLDLEHAAAARNNNIVVNDNALLCQSQTIVYTAGYGNSIGMDRNSVAAHNKEIVHQIFKGKNLLKTAVIIVVTNPVELISHWISELFDHNILVLGTGTSLDTFRLQYLLAKHLNVGVEAVEALVLGEHGKHMIPVFSKCQVSNKTVDALLSEQEKEVLLSALKASATSIRKTEAATKYGVSECVCQIVEHLMGAANSIPLSIKINAFYKELLQIQEDIFISLPCLVSESGVNIVNSLDYTNKEIQDLKAAANALHSLIQQVEI